MSKQTPITRAIEQIRTQAEDYQKRGNGDKSEALLDTINLLQSLLPYEMECFEGAYMEGAEYVIQRTINYTTSYQHKIISQTHIHSKTPPKERLI